MKIFNFEVEWKLYHHFRVEFDGEFDGNSLEALNSYFDPIIGPNSSIIGQKMKIFLFELEEKLDQHFRVKFDGKSDGNSFKALHPYPDPLIGPNWPLLCQKWKSSNLENVCDFDDFWQISIWPPHLRVSQFSKFSEFHVFNQLNTQFRPMAAITS